MIKYFEGKYTFLSNFTYCPIEYEGIRYPTNEHFFQAMKSLDREERKRIAACETPGRAKRMGRQVKLRGDWEKIKTDIMMLALRLKFSDPIFKSKLLETGDEELVEGNHWHDNTWGVCICENCPGTGENRLGKLLMQLREELKNN